MLFDLLLENCTLRIVPKYSFLKIEFVIQKQEIYNLPKKWKIEKSPYPKIRK